MKSSEDILVCVSGEDGSVLRSGQHGGGQSERLPSLPADGDLHPAEEAVPAAELPQRGHQVGVFMGGLFIK